MSTNQKKYHLAVVAASLCIGAAATHPAQASSIRHDEYANEAPAAKLDFGGAPEAGFGKQRSADARAMAMPEPDSGPAGQDAKPDWTGSEIEWVATGDKWEHSNAHPNDDKWEKHPNGIPGPVDNPCKAKYCGQEPPSPVPVPAAAWLLGSGLIGLLGLARRRAR